MYDEAQENDSSIIDDHPVLYCVAFFLLGLLGMMLEFIGLYRFFQHETLMPGLVAQSEAAEVMMHAANLGLIAIGIGVGVQIFLKHIMAGKA